MFTRDSVIISHNIKTPLTSISRAVGNILQLTYGQLVKSLFANNEQGFAYDPNDLTTMWQDATGTVPVTAVGQPVGLILDRSKGLAFGGEAVVGGNFENGLIGTLINSALSAGTLTLNTVSPISGTQDAKVTVTAVDGLSPQLRFNRSEPRIVGALYELSFDYRVLSGSPLIAQIYNGTGTYAVNKTLSGSGKFTARYMASGAGTSFDQIYFSINTFDMQIDNVSVKQILGNHAYQTTSASRPILRQNATTGAYYLEFDGVDDFLQTGVVPFGNSDEITVATSLGLPGGASTGCVVELGTNTLNVNGSFGLFRGSLVQAVIRGTQSKLNQITDNSSGAEVMTFSGKISKPLVSVRKNGVEVIRDISTLGTGTFTPNPIYIGRRAGTSLPFKGGMYATLGIARELSIAEIILIEKTNARNAGVTLNV